ncbi:MAG: citrate lyase acyl carrier protein [Spirochaetia bacterium]|jgi:citrate lyase subunit gamma (acyl carrier protein)|nr:citrate lyase acyl carrier protein [Spirochaetia bacterium]
MRIVKNSIAGTLESSDIHVEVSPGTGVEIDVQSTVLTQFGDSIKKTVMDVLREMEVGDVRVFANDRGALDCVIRARLETALLRAAGGDGP